MPVVGLVTQTGRKGRTNTNCPLAFISLWCFLHRAREHAIDGLIVVEGFFDTLDFWQRGRKNVVALMGSSLSEAQERLIVQTVGGRGRVLLAFDPDEAGRKGMHEAAARLVSQVFVRTVTIGS